MGQDFIPDFEIQNWANRPKKQLAYEDRQSLPFDALQMPKDGSVVQRYAGYVLPECVDFRVCHAYCWLACNADHEY